MENRELVSKAVEYAKLHADMYELSVKDIADAAGFSLDYFNRIFFMHTGFTVMAYVSYIRMKKAALPLRNTEKTVLEIALECGYESQEGFTRAFIKKYAVSPGEYRKQKKNSIITHADLVDQSVAARFLHENPDFRAVEPDDVIDWLMEQDVKKYGRFCAGIHCMGMTIAAPEGDFRRGFLAIRDDLKGGHHLDIVTEDVRLLENWVGRFKENISIYSMAGENEIQALLKGKTVEYQPLCVYSGEMQEYSMPDSVTVRRLTANDLNSIQNWAAGQNTAYIRHLMTPEHYQDETTLEYGVFLEDELIAVAGCGVDEVHGVRLNDCCIIRFAQGKERKEWYRPVYLAVTEDMWRQGIIPCEVMQFGELAQKHGGFEATDVGFEIVNRIYSVRG